MNEQPEQPQQQVDNFTLVIIEQRNEALNQLAYWRAKAIEAQAKLVALQPKPEAKPKEPADGGRKPG